MKKITQDTQFIINNKTYDLSLKQANFNMFKYLNKDKDFNYREMKIEFIKQSIENEISEYMGSNDDEFLKFLLNRIAMVDLLAEAGVSIEEIEYQSKELITDEELESYKNFELIKVGIYKEINLRR